MISKLDNFFKENGLYNSKYVYIYSDFTFFFEIYKKNPIKSVKSLLSLFLKRGITCVVPSFSYTKSGDFIVDRTKSKVGFLGNFIIQNFDHERSEHPLFSYVAIGKNKKIVRNIGKSAFGKDSVHERLYNKNTFFLNFCKPLNSGNTLVHHIEQINKSDYRFDKSFSAKVYDKNKYIGTSYKAYLRKNPDDKKTYFTFKKAIKYLNKRKYIKINNFDKIKIEIYDYNLFYEDLVYLINKEPKIFIKK
tara:strand:+ start:34 stop:774 length:741 start_codon:yes stop_codon:yes gene_type:complete